MKDGLYHVNPKSNQQDSGIGIVTVKDKKLTVITCYLVLLASMTKERLFLGILKLSNYN
ncbi:hypothetical protein [Yersinia entomophaga]|uniref:hypothetical protein n=1 Tax=Yersinia entomophaga TaxID=935293 RepID=UPI000AD711EF|nr:hypothetical protein [Yersinia entomophaga]